MTVAVYLDYMSTAKCDKFLYLRDLRVSSNPKLYEDYKNPIYFPDWLQRLPQLTIS